MSPQALSGKGGLVDQRHLGPGPGERQGRDASRRTTTDNDDVIVRRAHRTLSAVRIYIDLLTRGGDMLGTSPAIGTDWHRNCHATAPAYDRLAKVLAMGQNGPRVGHDRPHRARSTRGGSLTWPPERRGYAPARRAKTSAVVGMDLAVQMLAQAGQHRRCGRRPGPTRGRSRRAAAFPDGPSTRDLHLPPALRRRSLRDLGEPLGRQAGGPSPASSSSFRPIVSGASCGG